MGYEIYYDKRFLKIGEMICPVIQSGSSNYWQTGYPRDIPEKNWGVMNYPKRDQLLFKPDDLKEMYEKESVYQEDRHKSRYKYFDSFSKWLIAGIKNSMTLEEHAELNNTLLLVGSKDVDGKRERQEQVFCTEEEFHVAHEMLKSKGMHDIDVKFRFRDINKPRRKSTEKKKVEWKELDEYFVIESNGSYPVYFVRLTKYGYKYISFHDSSYVKKFEKQKDAQKYLEKNWKRLQEFHVQKIENRKPEKKEEKNQWRLRPSPFL